MVFENAGQTEGIEIWRIEDFNAVPYDDKKKFGKFHTGDSYIVLSTKENEDKKSYDLHYWLGAETSQDESGSAAVYAVELDDSLGGVPIQYREVQGSESAKFLSYFPQGVHYLPGGVLTGFTDVDVDVDPDKVKKRLFRVKGVKDIRVQEVPVSFDSLNKADCFILDTGKGQTVYVFMPPGARRMENFQGNQVANNIKDEDHAGDAEVLIIDENDNNFDKFFEALGAGSIDELPDVDADEAHQDDLEESSSVITLYALNGDSFEETATGPLMQDMLESQKVFLVSSGPKCGQLFLWVGSQADKAAKVAAVKAAESFIRSNGFPANTNIARFLEGLETAIFKHYFQDWA